MNFINSSIKENYIVLNQMDSFFSTGPASNRDLIQTMV